MLILFAVPLALAADPGCKGRVSDRDAELDFEIVLDADTGPQRAFVVMQGSGPDISRPSVQTRLRDQMKSLVQCYEPRVTETGGPDVTVRVGFDVVDGRPKNVTVDGPVEEQELKACVQLVVEDTPFLCKLSATGYAFPLRFYTLAPAAATSTPTP